MAVVVFTVLSMLDFDAPHVHVYKQKLKLLTRYPKPGFWWLIQSRILDPHSMEAPAWFGDDGGLRRQ